MKEYMEGSRRDFDDFKVQITSKVDENFHNLSSKVENLTQNFYNLSSKVDDLTQNFYNLSSKVENLTQNFYNLTSKVDDISSHVLNLEERVTGEKALNESQKSMVNLINDKNKVSACGNVVLFNETVYIVTARHAIFKEKNMCIKKRKIRHIQSKKTFNIVNAYAHPKKDIALILLNNKDQQFLLNYSAVLSKTPLKISDKLTGVCKRQKNVIFEVGLIREGRGFDFLTDLGGSKGQSGCGYFNFNKEIAAIHLGGGKYNHSGKKKKRKTKGEQTNNRNSTKGNNTEYTRILKELKKIRDENKKQSRNPRTRVEDVTILKNLNLDYLITRPVCSN
jgi:archaellum component FlaC